MSQAEPSERVALRLLVRGRVQGVGYRASCRHIAVRAGVDGWVRNTREGSVEIWIEGAPSSVEVVAAWCQVGPRHAVVTGTEVFDEAPARHTGFRIL